MRSSLTVPMFCHGRRGSAHLFLTASIQTAPVATVAQRPVLRAQGALA